MLIRSKLEVRQQIIIHFDAPISFQKLAVPKTCASGEGIGNNIDFPPYIFPDSNLLF